MDLKGKKVLVTGAGGFIGRKLVEALQRQEAHVRVLSRSSIGIDRQKVELFTADLTSKENSLDESLRDVAVVFNCAGELHNPQHMYKLHIGGTERLLIAAKTEVLRKGTPIHWVQAGSIGSYGPPSSGSTDVSVTECSPTDPFGPYEKSKTLADELVMRSAQDGLLTFSIVRIANVFGLEMTNRSLFSLIHSLQERLFFFIGPPGSSANYIHIENVIGGLLLAATHPRAKGEIYNLSNSCSMEHLVDVISADLGRPRPKIRLPYQIAFIISGLSKIIPRFPLTPTRVSALANRTRYPIDKIVKELGYSYSLSLEEGVRELVQDYKAYHQLKSRE